MVWGLGKGEILMSLLHAYSSGVRDKHGASRNNPPPSIFTHSN